MDKSRNFDSKIVFGFELEMLPFKPDFKNFKEKIEVFDFALVNYSIKTTVGTVNNNFLNFHAIKGVYIEQNYCFVLFLTEEA